MYSIEEPAAKIGKHIRVFNFENKSLYENIMSEALFILKLCCGEFTQLCILYKECDE